MGLFHNTRDNGQIAPQRALKDLKRQDLLELLLDQMREADSLRAELALAQSKMRASSELVERLQAKLDVKDGQLDRLFFRLDDKDEALRQVFAVAREIAVTEKESMRLFLLLQAEDILVDACLMQPKSDESAVPNPDDNVSSAAKTAVLRLKEKRVGAPAHPSAVPSQPDVRDRPHVEFDPGKVSGGPLDVKEVP